MSEVQQVTPDFAETTTELSALQGDFSSNFQLFYVLSPNGRRVFHSGSDRALVGLVIHIVRGSADRPQHMLDGAPFAPGHPYLPSTFTFSPDSMHTAYAGRIDDQWAVVLDGQKCSDGFDEIGRICFSGDSRHLVFAARRGQQWHVVVDNQAGPAFSAVKLDTLAANMDASRVAFEAERSGRRLLISDNQEVDATGALKYLFTEQGWRVLRLERDGRNERLLVDADPGPTFDRITRDSVLFSREGGHVAYLGRRGKYWHAVIDGREGPPYENLRHLILSVDGQRFAYAARKAGRWHAVVDGQEGPAYNYVEQLVFSPDGRRLAYAATTGRWWCFTRRVHVVVDGHEQERHRMVTKITFSPDGRRLAYVGRKGENSYQVWVDGVAEGPWYEVGELRFSDDSRHLAYEVKAFPLGDSRQVVADGKPGPVYESIATLPAFLADGTPVYVARGKRHTTEKLGFFDDQPPPDGILVVGPYESKEGLCNVTEGQRQRCLRDVARVGVMPSSAYAICFWVDESKVVFKRVEVTR